MCEGGFLDKLENSKSENSKSGQYFYYLETHQNPPWIRKHRKNRGLDKGGKGD
jgi:hypothetical protein